MSVRVSVVLARLGACLEAVEWMRCRAGQPGGLAATWEACERGDWLAWLAGALHRRGLIERRPLVLIACDCAERALRREREAGREPDPRLWRALEVARDEHSTPEQIQQATREAWNAALVAPYAIAAAWSVAYAASVANAAAANAGAYAAYAATAATDGTYAPAAERREQAAIVRRHVPLADVLRGLESVAIEVQPWPSGVPR